MTCQQFKKWLPLLAGGELPGKKARRAEAHLHKCPGCRLEAREFSAALAAAKGLAKTETLRDWTEAEWRRVLASVKDGKVDKRPSLRRLVQSPAFAFGIGVFLCAAALVMLGRRSPVPSTERPAAFAARQLSGPEVSPGQDVLSMTIISQETGLKIVWFFNKNFEWKENLQ